MTDEVFKKLQAYEVFLTAKNILTAKSAKVFRKEREGCFENFAFYFLACSAVKKLTAKDVKVFRKEH